MTKLRADGQIQKNDYVELIGKKLPERLQKSPKPIYGTVIKVKGKIAIIKPRYKRFEIEIPITELKDVPYEKFHNKQRKLSKKTKPATPVTVVGEGPVKVVPKPNAKPTFPEIVKEKIDMAEAAIDTNKPAPKVPEKVEADSSFTTKPEVTEPCETKAAFDANPDPMDPVEELTEDGNTMVYVTVGVLILAAAVVSYLLFF